MPDRLAGARDLWQRHLVRVQSGERPSEAELPAAVVRPETVDEVCELVALGRREGLAIVPFGAGSGVCGAVACDPRTLVVDTKRMRSLRKGDGDVLTLSHPLDVLEKVVVDFVPERGVRVSFGSASLDVGGGPSTPGNGSVPEPASGALLGLGLLAASWARRRYRA